MTHQPDNHRLAQPQPSAAFARALRERLINAHPGAMPARRPWLRWSAFTFPALAFAAFILFLQQEPLSAVHFLEKAQAATNSIFNFEGVWHVKERTTSAAVPTPDNVLSIGGSRFRAPDGEATTREQWFGTVDGRAAMRTIDTLDDGTIVDDSLAIYKEGDDWMIYPEQDYRLLPESERDLISFCVQRVPAFSLPTDTESINDIPPSELPDDELAWQLSASDPAATVAALAEMVRRGIAREVEPIVPGMRSFRVDEFDYVWNDDGDFTFDAKGNRVHNNQVTWYTVYTFDARTYLLVQSDRYGANTEGIFAWDTRMEYLLQETLTDDEADGIFDPVKNNLTDPWTLLPMTKEQILSREAETGCYLNGEKRGENEYDLEPLGDEIYARVQSIFVEDPTIEEATGW